MRGTKKKYLIELGKEIWKHLLHREGEHLLHRNYCRISSKLNECGDRLAVKNLKDHSD